MASRMPDIERDIIEEQAILDRLAQAHKGWRDRRPPIFGPQEDHSTLIERVLHQMENPVPQDIEILRIAAEDPLHATIWSLLSVVGWRLYAKGGADLLSLVYQRLEIDEHPGFADAVSKAWQDIGFSDDPRGVWCPTDLL